MIGWSKETKQLLINTTWLGGDLMFSFVCLFFIIADMLSPA